MKSKSRITNKLIAIILGAILGMLAVLLIGCGAEKGLRGADVPLRHRTAPKRGRPDRSIGLPPPRGDCPYCRKRK